MSAFDPTLRDELRDVLAVGPRGNALRWYARMLAGSEEAGEDLLQEAIAEVCNPGGRPWDPARGTLKQHLRFVIHDTWRWRARRGLRTREQIDDGIAADDSTIDPRPLPDAALGQKREVERLERMALALRARLGVGSFDYQVFALRVSDGGSKADIASALGQPLGEVDAAFERILYQAKKVRDEEDARSVSRPTPRLRGMLGAMWTRWTPNRSGPAAPEDS